MEELEEEPGADGGGGDQQDDVFGLFGDGDLEPEEGEQHAGANAGSDAGGDDEAGGDEVPVLTEKEAAEKAARAAWFDAMARPSLRVVPKDENYGAQASAILLKIAEVRDRDRAAFDRGERPTAKYLFLPELTKALADEELSRVLLDGRLFDGLADLIGPYGSRRPQGPVIYPSDGFRKDVVKLLSRLDPEEEHVQEGEALIKRLREMPVTPGSELQIAVDNLLGQWQQRFLGFSHAAPLDDPKKGRRGEVVPQDTSFGQGIQRVERENLERSARGETAKPDIAELMLDREMQKLKKAAGVKAPMEYRQPQRFVVKPGDRRRPDD